METDFETGPRAEYSENLVRKIAAYFGLGKILTQTDLGGAYNLNLLLHSSNGDFVARVYRPWVNPDRLTFLQAVKHGLRAADLPLPESLGWVAGNRIGLKMDRLIEVERFIPSERGSAGWMYHIKAYSMLGRIHQALKEQEKSLTFVPPVVHNYGHPAELLGWLKKTTSYIAHQKPASERDTALAVCSQSAEILKYLNTWWKQTGQDLPQQLVHGDYGAENILWRRGEITALLDFDLADIHERVFELAYTTYWLFKRCEGKKSPEKWPWQRLPELLTAYQNGNGQALSADELNSIPIEMARVPYYWIATAGFEADPVDAVLALSDDLDWAKWLITHPNEVLAHCKSLSS